MLRSLDSLDAIRRIFVILADGQGSIILIWPGADLDQRQVELLKSPFNGIAVDQVGVSIRNVSADPDQGLESAVVDELPEPVFLGSQQRAAGPVGDQLLRR